MLIGAESEHPGAEITTISEANALYYFLDNLKKVTEEVTFSFRDLIRFKVWWLVNKLPDNREAS